MSEAIAALKSAGYTDEQIATWAQNKREEMVNAGHSEEGINSFLGGQEPPPLVPRPLFDRFRQGAEFVRSIGNLFGPDASTRILTAGAKTSSEAVGPEPFTPSPEFEAQMARLPWTNAIWGPEIRAAASTLKTIGSVFTGTVAGLAGAAGQVAQELGASETSAARLTRDVASAPDALAGLIGVHSGAHPMAKFERGPLGEIHAREIGGLPKANDFHDAATLLSNGQDMDHVRAKLEMLYENHGVHPAEVLADAEKDPVLAASILSHGFEVWHGTPHDFEAFDLSKIGTGEGAQVFGHGLYFAERQGVADYYKRSVQAGPSTDFQGRLREVAGMQGNMYSVRIMASKEGFLDRDLPLREQQPEVLAKLMQVADSLKPGAGEELARSPTKAGDWFDIMSHGGGAITPKEWSDKLRDAGLPGLKYFDAASRFGGGTQNFVVFDDRIVRIAAKNEEAVIPGSLRSGELHSVVAETGKPEIDNITQDPIIRAAIDNPKIDSTGKVPLGAGASADLNDMTVRVDASIPHEVTIGAVTFDPRIPAVIHELVERERMEALIQQGKTAKEAYEEAHYKFAEPAENAWVTGHGIDLKQYNELWREWLKGTEVEDLKDAVQGLYKKPYEDTEAGEVHSADAVRLAKEMDYPTGPVINRRPLAGSAAEAAAAEKAAKAPAPGTIEEAQQHVLDKISIGDKATEGTKWTWANLYTWTVNKVFPIERAVNELAAGRLQTAEDAGKLARLYAGWSGKAVGFLRYGTRDFNTYAVNGKSLEAILSPVAQDMDGFRAFVAAARDGELGIRGLKTAFDPDKVKQLVRAGMAEYKDTFEELVEYQNRVSAYLRDSGVISTQAYDRMLEDNKLFVPFHRVVGDAVDAGRLRTGSGLQAYNPIKKIRGSEKEIVDPIENVIRNTFLLTQMAERNFVGTRLVDILLSGERDVKAGLAAEAEEVLYRPDAVSRDIKNWLAEQGVKTPEELAEAIKVAAVPLKDGEIAVFRDGARQTYKVDPELARAMKGLDAESIGFFEKLMKPLASTLRAGAIATPEFAARHTLRDFLLSFVTTTKGIYSPIDMARGFAGLYMKDGDYWDWLQGGGGVVSMVSLDRRFLRENLDTLTQQTGLMTRAWNVVVDPQASWLQKGGAVAGLPLGAVSKFVIHPLQVVSDFAMTASHLGAYKKAKRAGERAAGLPDKIQDGQYALKPGVSADDGVNSIADAWKANGGDKQGILDAAWTSRETSVDASRIGAKMRGFNMIAAFSNIEIQHTDRIVRAFGTNPIGTSLKIGLGITLPSLLNWWVNKDDSRYQELPEWEKDLFWIVPTDKWEAATPEQAASRNADQVRLADGQLEVNNGSIYRIPKPFGAGVIFGSGPERMADFYYHKNPNAFKGFGSSVVESTVPNLIPNALSPVIEQAMNRQWTNRTLIPATQEKFLPEYQYGSYTTETTKALGKIVSAFPGIREASVDEESKWVGGVARAITSPTLMENYVNGWFGSLGRYALQTADYGLRKTGAVPDPERPVATLADMPVIKAFVARYPTAATQSIQDFYDGYGVGKRYFDTFMAKAKEGDEAAMQRIADLGGPQMFVRLDGIKKALGEHQRLIQLIDKNGSIPAAEKRQLIDSVYYRMIEMGRFGNQALGQIKAGLSSQ